jgi:hypothetical protein
MNKQQAKKLLSQNSKIKTTSQELGVQVFNFNIPAFKSDTGKITCPFALNDGSEKDCVKFCYAQAGNYKRFAKSINPGMEYRYKLSKTVAFVPLLIEAIKTLKADYIRIHDSGDFYSPKYVAKWVQIAEALPGVKFYAYTKSHDFFRGIEIPPNMDIIFSEGSKLDAKLNKETERHASIFKSLGELQEAGYQDASKIDLLATKFYSSNHRIGLIYH